MGLSTQNISVKRGCGLVLSVLAALTLSSGIFSACGSRLSPVYLTWTELSRLPISSPPGISSEEEKADFAILTQWQAKRTGAQCSQASNETKISFKTMFGKLHPFKRPAPAVVKRLFKNANADAYIASTIAKERFHRPRPYTRDGNIKPCVSVPSGYSYPSGHATTARLYARILADLDPKCAAAYIKRADDIALNRVIGGVHYFSDIESGKQLADELYAALQNTPSFRKDMEAARAFATEPCQR